MNISNDDDDYPSPQSHDEVESPRKRMRLDNSARKSWSLMDRRTDHEVLQEMGVSLLEPDETEIPCETPMHQHRGPKRKRDIENVNPNINGIMSPRGKQSPRSPRSKVCSPSAGPSRLKSPLSDTISKMSHDPLLESDYLIDEETPLGQSVRAEYLPTGPSGKRSFTPTSPGEPTSQHRPAPTGSDSFSALSDEMMLSVFRWLPKRTLAHCMLVCKRWYRVACDETLWQRLDLGNKTLARGALGRVLRRQPAVVRLASSEIGDWTPSTPPPASRIQYLDLSMCTVSVDTLDTLLELCPLLRKLSLESMPLADTSLRRIGNCTHLEALNLTMAQGITPEGLTAVLEGCTGLQSLNISWCGLTEESLEVLVTSLPPKLLRLNVGGARLLTDDMVEKLAERCPRLAELDLSDCSRAGGAALTAIGTLRRLQHLALSRCYLLPAHALTKLSAMPSLQYLEVWGMLQTTSLNALRTALPAIQINQFMFSAIARPTVGTRRTSIWGLRTRD